jgi:hypothetical protein
VIYLPAAAGDGIKLKNMDARTSSNNETGGAMKNSSGLCTFLYVRMYVAECSGLLLLLDAGV